MRQTKEKKEEVIWDKKRIIFFILSIIILVFIGIRVKSHFLDSNYSLQDTNTVKKEQVKGITTQDLSNGIRQSIQQDINKIKTEAQNINVVDIATSSPQVQKVINDLKSLQNLPKNQFKEACEKVCNGL